MAKVKLGLLLVATALLLGSAAIAPAQGMAPGGRLYLLAGTTSGDAAAIFPVILYALVDGKPELVRQIFGQDQGMFDAREDFAGHIYVLDYRNTRVSIIHEDNPANDDVVLFPGDLGPPGTRGDISFYYPTWGVAAGPGSCLCMLLESSVPGGWKVTTVLGTPTPVGAGVAEGSDATIFSRYADFRYGGSVGQPAQAPEPQAMVIQGKIAILSAGKAILTSLGNAPLITIPCRGKIGDCGCGSTAWIAAAGDAAFSFFAPT